MKFNYDDYFNKNDIIAISKEDVDLILKGDNPAFKEISAKDMTEIKEKFSSEDFDDFKGLDQTIIYIKSNEKLSLYDQSEIIGEVRKVFEKEINVLYGVGLDDSMKGIKVLLIASKKKA